MKRMSTFFIAMAFSMVFAFTAPSATAANATTFKVQTALTSGSMYFNILRPGGRGQLPTRGSHGSGRAPFGHPAPQIMVSLLNGTHCARRAQGGGDRC